VGHASRAYSLLKQSASIQEGNVYTDLTPLHMWHLVFTFLQAFKPTSTLVSAGDACARQGICGPVSRGQAGCTHHCQCKARQARCRHGARYSLWQWQAMQPWQEEWVSQGQTGDSAVHLSKHSLAVASKQLKRYWYAHQKIRGYGVLQALSQGCCSVRVVVSMLKATPKLPSSTLQIGRL